MVRQKTNKNPTIFRSSLVLFKKDLRSLMLLSQVITNLVSSNNANLPSYHPVGQNPTQVSLGRNQGVSGVRFLSGNSWGDTVSLPFPASRGHTHSLALGPFLHLQSQLRGVCVPPALVTLPLTSLIYVPSPL